MKSSRGEHICTSARSPAKSCSAIAASSAATPPPAIKTRELIGGHRRDGGARDHVGTYLPCVESSAWTGLWHPEYPHASHAAFPRCRPIALAIAWEHGRDRDHQAERREGPHLAQRDGRRAGN